MAGNSGALERAALLVAISIVLLTARTSWGQSTQAEMMSFPMPPAAGYKVEKTFTHAGDYGYFLSDNQPRPTMSFSQGTTADLDYDYFRYAGVRGRNVYIYGAWGSIPIPPPTPTGDACAHSHLSYGVWAKYTFELAFAWF